MSGGLRLDLHVHSRCSPDGRAEVDQFVAALSGRNLEGFALTDHNTIAGHPRLAEIALEHPSIRLLPGVEVSTAEGHLLAYGLTQLPPQGKAVAETVEWVEAHGGVPVLAHPFRRVHGVGDAIARRARVPSVETLNGHNGARANARAAAVVSARRLGSTGGSDAHDPRDLGRTWTVFPEGAATVDDLLEALRRGTTTAAGRSADAGLRLQLAFRSLGLRIRRGFRPI